MEKTLKAIAPWSFLGAILTIFVTRRNELLNISYEKLNLTNFRHLALLAIAILMPLTTFKFKLQDYFNSIIFIAFFIFFVAISTTIATSLIPTHPYGNFEKFTTGLYYESYNYDYKIFKLLKMPYSVPTILFYILSLGFAIFTIYGLNKIWYWIHRINKMKQLKEEIKELNETIMQLKQKLDSKKN